MDEQFDAAIKSYRRRVEMDDVARQYPSIHFPPPETGDPWEEGFGMLRDEPLFNDWVAAVEELRRERAAAEAGVSSAQDRELRRAA